MATFKHRYGWSDQFSSAAAFVRLLTDAGRPDSIHFNSLTRILYIDDDVDGGEMIVAWLHDYEVTTAGDGRQAKELMQRMRFDLYILDFYLPDMTAIDLCEDIRRVSPRVPIIIYSALTRWSDKKTVIEAGATKYLSKPNDLEKLIPEIVRSLGEEPPRDTRRPTRIL